MTRLVGSSGTTRVRAQRPDANLGVKWWAVREM